MQNKRIETVSSREEWWMTGEQKMLDVPSRFPVLPLIDFAVQGESTRIPAAPRITVIDPLAVTSSG
jgi:hypothetical protein